MMDQNGFQIVLPSRIPNLLVNGATGIAVGIWLTSHHNSNETITPSKLMVDNPEVTNNFLNWRCPFPGPDLSATAGQSAVETGIHCIWNPEASVVLRSRTEIETTKSGRERISCHRGVSSWWSRRPCPLLLARLAQESVLRDYSSPWRVFVKARLCHRRRASWCFANKVLNNLFN